MATTNFRNKLNAKRSWYTGFKELFVDVANLIDGISAANGYSNSEIDALLNAKANTSHSHASSDISNFNLSVKSAVQSDLDAKANTSHSHIAADISDFMSAAQSALAPQIQQTLIDAENYADSLIQTIIGVSSPSVAFDTLKEISDYLAQDEQNDAAVLLALSMRLRFDVANQNLSTTQKQNALTNLGIQNIDNTSDADKPVSTLTQQAITAAINYCIQRGNHSGSQIASTISDLVESVQDIIGTSLANGNNIRITYNDSTGLTTLDAIPSGSNKNVQFNNNGSIGAAANVNIDGNDLLISNNDTPSTPANDTVKIHGKLIGPSGSMTIPSFINSFGTSIDLQSSLWSRKISRWNPGGNSATVPGVDGFPALTALGTATARSIATTNTLTRSKRIGYVSAATAGSFAGHYATANQFSLGTGSGTGGFLYCVRIGISDATLQTACNGFIGLSSSVAAPTNVNPNTLTNCFGLGYASGDTNWYLYYGGSSAQTRINLGASFPLSIGNLIEMVVISPPNQNGVIYYRIRIIGTSTVVIGTIGPGTAGVTLPANTTLLSHRAWRCNNALLVAVGLDISTIYFDTEY